MHTAFANAFTAVFTYLLQSFLGSNPKMDADSLIHLFVAFCLLWMLVLRVGAALYLFLLMAWLEHRAQAKLQRLADRLGFQTRRETKFFARTFVCEGLHRGRSVRFLTCRWRGGPMLAVATACPEPAGLWLQVRPKLNWFVNALFNIATCGPQDLRANDARLRALPTGDPSFDDAYAVKSNQPALAVELLGQKTRDGLMKVRRRLDPMVTIADGEIRYALHARLFNSADLDQLAEKMDLVCDLAEAAEAVKEKNARLGGLNFLNSNPKTKINPQGAASLRPDNYSTQNPIPP